MNKLFNTLGGAFGTVLVLAVVGWVLYRWLKNSDDPARLVFKWFLTVILAAFVISTAVSASGPFGKFIAIAVGAISGLALAAIWVPNLTNAFASPFMDLYTGGSQPPDPQPFYSIAQAKRKQGKYREAIVEIRRQLASFPGDFAGTMMLAEIEAEHLDDLPGAANTIEKLLTEKERTAPDAALALNRLADWELKYGQDPESARCALERIVAMFPDTEQAYMATQRIAHLTTPEMLAEKKEPHRIKLGQYQENIGLLTEPAHVHSPVEEAPAKAARLIGHLQEHPEDDEAREQLALLYADHYGRLDLAAGQLEELISQPGAPARKVAHWLNVLTDIRIKHANDLAGARDALQRIINLYPELAAAQTARNRLAHLQLELRANQKNQVVRLGTYESNIGLK